MRRLLACLLPLAALVAAPLATAEECVRGVPAPPPELPPRPVAEPKLHDFATGAGVTVAVIDTGIHPHPELLHLEPGHDVTNAAVSDPHHDCDGHGTAVAGIIAAQTSGTAPDARIVPIRQTTAYARMPAGHGDEGEGEGTLASLTAAIHLALDEGADIINVSVVACTDAEVDDHELNEALRRAEEDNAVIVAAAGNRTTDCHDHATVYPTHAPTVIGVQATQGSAEAAEYSLTLPPDQPRLSAPGQVPVALAPDSDGWVSAITPPNGENQEFHGTSFAAPVVAGTAALLRERYPEYSAAELREHLFASAQSTTDSLDPLAALTTRPAPTPEYRTAAITAPVAEEHSVDLRVLIVLAGVMVVLAIATGLRRPPAPVRRRRRLTNLFKEEP